MVNGRARKAGDSRTPTSDRSIILIQLGLGTLLVIFGAMLLVIFKATNVLGSNTDLTAVGGNIATGVLGIGAALLPAGAASAASSRILSSLPQPATPAPVFAGISATADPAGGGSNVSGHVITGDAGFWFVQYGSKTGDYQKMQAGGPLTGRPGAQDISTSAPIQGLAPGNFFRVGFTANNTGQTTYSQEVTVTTAT
jgi:hypothetical protein